MASNLLGNLVDYSDEDEDSDTETREWSRSGGFVPHAAIKIMFTESDFS
jgi:hypothetical protein